ncbi:hypothetical protein EXS66_00985 [Candidatus Saccharibacteria bacterium]|nr:hypothetical protein [Candidatus Saccharibacteria bacterium]
MKPDDKKTGSVESAPDAGELAIEQNPNQHIVPSAEAQPAVASTTIPHRPAAASTTATAATTSKTSDNDDNPTSHYEAEIAQLPAEDSGPIEPEWIKKADEIVAKTSSDPYHEDDAQHSLSRAYLKKRFKIETE